MHSPVEVGAVGSPYVPEDVSAYWRRWSRCGERRVRTLYHSTRKLHGVMEEVGQGLPKAAEGAP